MTATVRQLIDRFQATSVLDYGCGNGTLKAELRPLCDSRIRIDEYDATKSGLPSFADIVVCAYLLERVSTERRERILAHIRKLTRKAAFVVMASGEGWTETLEGAGFQVERVNTQAQEFSAVLT